MSDDKKIVPVMGVVHPDPVPHGPSRAEIAGLAYPHGIECLRREKRIAALTAENEALTKRVAVLETVLRTRMEFIETGVCRDEGDEMEEIRAALSAATTDPTDGREGDGG